jgi:hypothetical protein
MSYPDISDPDFYKFVNKKYARYKIPKTHPTMREICFPKKYEFQIPQKFVADFISPQTPYMGLLIYHKIGAGKTCAAIKICEKFKHKKKILIVVPASLKNNFRAELRSLCASENYLTDEERELLLKYHPSDYRYKEIITDSNKRIDRYYRIISYNKFVEYLKAKTLKLDNTLVVIDEIHNLISETGTFYETIYNAFRKPPGTMRLVIMTATPIFDKPVEIALTMNLLIRGEKMPIGNKFYDTFIEERHTFRGPTYEVKNMDLFKEYIRGYVSYFAGAPAIAFPKSEIHFVKCQMSPFQLKLYKKVFAQESKDDKPFDPEVDISNSFFIGTRLISNFVFPNGKLGLEGFESMRKIDFDPDHLAKYSPKMLKIVRRIKRCKGTVFVYSNFKEFGGVKMLGIVLEAFGFKDYNLYGPGRKRFAIWSGDTEDLVRDEIKNVFNRKDNEFGTQLKVILGSPSASTGVSFFRVQEVHLLEAYWNWSKLDQIIGRGIRFCSHKDVSADRRLVKVYIYMAVHEKIDISIDQHIMQIAIQKQKINIGFENALKEASIDCTLFANANNQTGEEKIICEI